MRRFILFSLLFLLAAASRAQSTTETLLARILAGEARTEIPAPSGPDTELWILAGQSNMQGVGILRKQPEPDQRIWALRMSNEWEPAQHPLHLLPASIFGAHRKTLNWTPEQQAAMYADYLKRPAGMIDRCVGPGLAFARAIVDDVGKPIGLIPTAHGGTTLEQWNPDRKSEGTDSLYGAMIERARLAVAGGKGGKLRGLLWYQGESDAIQPKLILKDDGTTETVGEAYERQWIKFIDAVRNDLGEPDLPIIYVQLGRFTSINPALEEPWTAVREAQRRVAPLRKNLYLVSAVDLPLDDPIHISYEGQERLGRRMAEVALRRVYGMPKFGTAIELDGIENLGPDEKIIQPSTRIRVKFNGVNGRLKAEGRPSGFAVMKRKNSGDDGIVNIHEIALDPENPSAVLLSIQTSRFNNLDLYYAPGLDPYANIVDEHDISIPAFGPLPVPDPPAAAVSSPN